MLKSGNTSFFNHEQNKNFFSVKKFEHAQKFTQAGINKAAMYKACKNFI